ncbi:MAG: hypothetical protein DMG96_28065 [Acidobacteria bacterium]|nr:MAG: hypothetical protein DMG96_28065 [Acidobacteriota bacterium]
MILGLANCEEFFFSVGVRYATYIAAALHHIRLQHPFARRRMILLETNRPVHFSPDSLKI